MLLINYNVDWDIICPENSRTITHQHRPTKSSRCDLAMQLPGKLRSTKQSHWVGSGRLHWFGHLGKGRARSEQWRTSSLRNPPLKVRPFSVDLIWVSVFISILGVSFMLGISVNRIAEALRESKRELNQATRGNRQDHSFLVGFLPFVRFACCWFCSLVLFCCVEDSGFHVSSLWFDLPFFQTESPCIVSLSLWLCRVWMADGRFMISDGFFIYQCIIVWCHERKLSVSEWRMPLPCL